MGLPHFLEKNFMIFSRVAVRRLPRVRRRHANLEKNRLAGKISGCQNVFFHFGGPAPKAYNPGLSMPKEPSQYVQPLRKICVLKIIFRTLQRPNRKWAWPSDVITR